MRTRTGPILAATLALLAVAGLAEEIADDALGLSGSVFDTPDPLVPASSAGDPGDNRKLGSYFEGEPPMISHRIEDFLPITLGENLCLDCHQLPEEIGDEIADDEATPIPGSHYVDLRSASGAAAVTASSRVAGARYVCTQCHASQTDTKLLVASTYRR